VEFDDGSLRIAAKYLRLDDKELLQKTYESSIDENKLPAKQYPTLDELKTILDQLALKDPKARSATPQDFVDARFVEEFDKSGYIDSLYGRKNNRRRQTVCGVAFLCDLCVLCG
jgi:hypothetical protein